jgi:hypothetical protein
VLYQGVMYFRPANLVEQYVKTLKTISTVIYPGFAAIQLACFVLSPPVRTSTHPPTRLPRLSIAKAQDEGASRTTDIGNTTVAFNPFCLNTTSSVNRTNGFQMCHKNTIRLFNPAIGVTALKTQCHRSFNTDNRLFALYSNTSDGVNNVLVCYLCLPPPPTADQMCLFLGD